MLVHKGGSKKLQTNCNYKCIMMLIRDSINEWVEESCMLGDVQFLYRRGHSTENLFMLERWQK